MQFVQLTRLPPRQVHFELGPVHVGRHPKTEGKLTPPSPSSQVSGGITSPSPHMSEQEEFPPYVWVQLQPEATPEHPERHPSPLFELSSQVSVPTIKPSPHVEMQLSGRAIVPPEQVQPSIAPEQSVLHPFPSILLPSSHSSGEISFPSPQSGVQEAPKEGQSQPGMI